MDITKALAIFLPLVRTLVLEAEGSGAGGKEKHDAVANAARVLYTSLQKSVKELRDVPWEVMEPLILAPAVGLIDVVVSMLNSLWGKVWSFMERLVD